MNSVHSSNSHKQVPSCFLRKRGCVILLKQCSATKRKQTIYLLDDVRAQIYTLWECNAAINEVVVFQKWVFLSNCRNEYRRYLLYMAECRPPDFHLGISSINKKRLWHDLFSQEKEEEPPNIPQSCKLLAPCWPRCSRSARGKKAHDKCRDERIWAPPLC